MIRRFERLTMHFLERALRNGINSLYSPDRERLQRWLGPIVESAHARLALHKVNTFYLVTLQYEGPEPDRPSRVLYAARDDVDWDESLRYACFLLFGEEEPSISERMSCSARDLRARVEQMRSGCDLVIVDANRHLLWRPHVGEWVISPQQVRMVLDFQPGETWAQVKKRLRSQRRNIRLFEKAAFTQLRHSKTESDLAYFYDRMYLPLVQRRYAHFAYIDRKKTLLDWLRRGELVFIVDPDGRDVAGSVNINQGPVKFMMVNGVLDADPELIAQGALSSVYYHCIRIGFENGFRRCDFGETRPFEDDGVYQHKTHWGMKTLRDPWGVNRWLFWAPGDSPRARRWLRARPFVRAVCLYGGWSPMTEGEPEDNGFQPAWEPAEPERTEDRIA